MYSASSTSGTLAHALPVTHTPSRDGTGGSPPRYLSRSIARRKAARCGKGEIADVPTSERAELAKAGKRIRELELKVEILSMASRFLEEDRLHPKGRTGDRPALRRLADREGLRPNALVSSPG